MYVGMHTVYSSNEYSRMDSRILCVYSVHASIAISSISSMANTLISSISSSHSDGVLLMLAMHTYTTAVIHSIRIMYCM